MEEGLVGLLQLARVGLEAHVQRKGGRQPAAQVLLAGECEVAALDGAQLPRLVRVAVQADVDQAADLQAGLSHRARCAGAEKERDQGGAQVHRFSPRFHLNVQQEVSITVTRPAVGTN
nr:hypothetical protein [Variovorax soli]